ncbi:MAG: GGDEF domain-containing protein [Meiothermus sp.]|uniref:GGDEF domain-containing protein n=1 Tax=Meiothermus sp. TaxID=1955249 RepID=UPI0025D4E775|nr:GGDEF domain-containing protein [Meiothermus sp.]MCS7067766.1 GGDEF domain-containing protein [Meiothermus sp.]MCX7600889.1 GGDEF domain-containing protein [Meiothermus sp.]MDW8425554.1 GGDEF domain-containing protein [Meiothermus sp.]
MPPQPILELEDSTAPLRARAYFYILPVVVWAALFAWFQLDIPSEETFYEKYSLLIMAVWLGLCWLGLLLPRWVRFHTVERGVFWSTALLMVFNVYYNLLAVNSEGLWNSSLWIAVVFVMAYFVFAPRQAWLVSLGIFAAFVIVGLLALVPPSLRGMPLDQNAVVQLYVSQLCYLILFRLLVLSKEHSLRVRLEAAKLYGLAHTDPLTNVANRRSIMEALYQALEQNRQTGQPLSLALLDLDRFKQINDQYGHEMGDKALVHTAQVLKQNLRPGDLLGRWGGEEFVLLLPNTSLQEARQLCEHLQQKLIENPLDNLRPVSASFGIATATPGDTPDYLISRADTAMYLSKQAGGNRVEVA